MLDSVAEAVAEPSVVLLEMVSEAEAVPVSGRLAELEVVGVGTVAVSTPEVESEATGPVTVADSVPVAVPVAVSVMMGGTTTGTEKDKVAETLVLSVTLGTQPEVGTMTLTPGMVLERQVEVLVGAGSSQEQVAASRSTFWAALPTGEACWRAGEPCQYEPNSQ